MASAALDAETARTVTDSLLNLKGLTRVAVTQRLEPSALSRYDGIIVMKNGRVSEQGSFNGLMEAKNQFYALFMLRALLHFFGLKKYLAYLTVRPVTRLTLFSIVFLMFRPSFLRSLIREARR